jgi:O-antigen/teichoic acid export membrane protein
MLKGLFWDFLGKIFSQGFAFIASIFLARLLLPEDFGLVAIALVFINISQVFIDAGFGAALIQKDEVSPNLYSSVFWLNIFSGIILTVLFVFISKWVAYIYEAPELKEVLQYFSLAFLINSLGVIQRTQLVKKMDFKKLSIVTAVATLLSGIIAIYIAFETKSYWALVVQQLSMFGFTTIFLWIANSWRPKFHFSIEDLRSVWKFSSRIFTDGILTNVINSVDTILIGKMFPTNSLGLYSRAKNLSEMVRSYSSGGVASVVFPAISKIQNNSKGVKEIFNRMNTSIAVFSVLLSLILFLFAEPIILFLYTAKWAGSIFFF